jgi:hypothetical protein
MDSYEEDVITACVLYRLSEEEGEMKTGPHPEFSLGGGGGDDYVSIYNLCLFLKIMF